MGRERWGTFSVIDHLQNRAFVTDVLLYNRLVIPFPPTETERARWFKNNWQPDKLDAKLELLGDIAVPVAWDKSKQIAFNNLYQTSSAVNSDIALHLDGIRNNIDYEVDKQNPYEITKAILSKWKMPEMPGVTTVWAMAAYSSYEGYKKDIDTFALNTIEKQSQRHLSMIISQKFLVPENNGKSDDDMLKDAIKLVDRDDFKEKRIALYKWQESIINENISDVKAIEELEELLKQYNKIVEKAASGTRWKFGFLVLNLLGAGAGLATGHIETLPAVGLGLTGLASITQYLKFDRKLDITKDSSYAAAMIHDVKKGFSWK